MTVGLTVSWWTLFWLNKRLRRKMKMKKWWKQRCSTVNRRNVEVSRHNVKQIDRASYLKTISWWTRTFFVRLGLLPVDHEGVETYFVDDVADVNSWIRRQINLWSTILRNVICCCQRSAKRIQRRRQCQHQRSFVLGWCCHVMRGTSRNCTSS